MIYSSGLKQVRKLLSANLRQSPLMRSYEHALLDVRSSLFIGFPPAILVYLQYAG